MPREPPWGEWVPWDPRDLLVPQGRLVSRALMDPWDLEESPASWALPGRSATSDPKVGGCIHTQWAKILLGLTLPPPAALVPSVPEQGQPPPLEGLCFPPQLQ